MQFSKYHGLGNDFLIVDLRAEPNAPEAVAVQSPEAVRALCDRRFGVGGDGVLAVLPGSADEPADARMRVLNADGSEAEMCGNGLRCVVKYLYERDPALHRNTLAIATGAGVLRCAVHAQDGVAEAVTVNMGRPRLARAEIPMVGPERERCVAASLVAADRELSLTAVSMGNPHVVAFVEESGSALRALAERAGPQIERHPWFPQRTNVEFAHVHDDRRIELVVWERGCGITLACGTGACATAVAACITGHTRQGTETSVHLLGGELTITVAPEYETVYMRGPATHVYDAAIDILAFAARVS